MMKRVFTIIAVCMGMTIGSLYGQQDFLISQVNFDPAIFNPAAVGHKALLNATLLHRSQWTGYPGAPVTSGFNLNAPISDAKYGIGFYAMQDRIGVTERSDIFATYSYHLKLTSSSKLSFGIRAGINHLVVANTNHRYWDAGDDLLTTNLRSIQPNAGFGIAYKRKDLYVGVAIPGLINYRPSFFSLEGAYELERHYLFQATNKFKISEQIKLQPGVFMRYVHNSPLQADFNLMAIYNGYLGAGGGYRTGDAAFANIWLRPVDRISIGYAYDFVLTRLQNYSNGTHEVMIQFGLWHKEKVDIPSFIKAKESTNDSK